MSIDWNTAPEGATHWEPRGIVFGEGWMKKVGNEWSYWLEGSEVWAGVWADCFVSAEREATFEARPQEAWDEQGLPPVGTVCDYRHMIWPEYRSCEIRYISEESLVAYDDGQEQFYRTCDMLFRPVRTLEQIAAEEREKAINQMISDAGYVDPKIGTFVAMRNLYDAGYRRQESST
ncbi:hypothetical protein ACM7N4_24175 [Pseudomonas aeruginosa]|uniref:hypothetical protein n=1 Tax=Pseudomonas aeruginosa TaxID=287 RepID=UPI002A6AE3DA|nr:hypothetical protein [Pseudomonas aeruginosa]MDY1084408.1 hypothetical protein [Pseudomonas aeruginosa]